MLPNWLYGKSKSKLASILGGGGAPADYDEVKAQVTQNTEDIEELTDESLTKSYEPTQLATPRISFNSVTIRKIGKIVNINFDATILVDLTSEQTTLFQIPSDIRTSTKQYAIAANINANTAYRLEVNDNNNVNVNHGGIKAGQEIVGNITYELL